MDYQNYEEYMRSVLGYSPYVGNDYTYTDEQEDIYAYSNEVMPNAQVQDLSAFYPEIYKIIYPMVCKVCNTNSGRELTKELLEQMINEIYSNVEPEQEIDSSVRNQAPLKNGDVRNPNAKEPIAPAKETRQTNFLLRDLIRILILREWGRPNRPPMRPPFPGGRPPMGPGGPGNMQPPRPGPGRPPMGPQPRPRYF
ncbi:MAG: hypothetical protein IJE59_05530 [Clostridia bacterium]|nr:hypothetical protein [Clostridia bacterium]